MSKVALITGITGQDGSYLAEFLLGAGYKVHGLLRRSSSFNTARIDHIFDRLNLHHGDLLDSSNLQRLVSKIQPSEVYHLGAQSHVRVSFDMPEHTVDVGAVGTMRLFEAIRTHAPEARVYNAASSEMFGGLDCPETGYTEESPFHPRSPYGCAKVCAYWLAKNYREAYDLQISNGILFNHESPRRGETFVTRKITRAVARIVVGKQDKLILGNLDARRDWGYAKDYVEAMWRMLNGRAPNDYVIATGETHSVREFLDEAFECAGLGDWSRYVETDPRYLRPSEVDVLLGDARKAQRILNWSPTTTFHELVRIMVEADIKAETHG